MNHRRADAVRCVALTKRFGAADALVELTAAMPAATVTAILGANGAGKSTLLRIIAGLTEPTSGSAALLPLDERAPRLGYVPETPELYPSMTVREHLRFVSLLHELGPEWRASADELLDALALAHVADALPSALSFGMQRKVSVACALLPQPTVLLLDEPFNGLDTAACAALERLLSGAASTGAAVVLSTHDLPQVANVAEHCLVLAGGRVRFEGELSEFAAPETAVREDRRAAHELADRLALALEHLGTET